MVNNDSAKLTIAVENPDGFVNDYRDFQTLRSAARITLDETADRIRAEMRDMAMAMIEQIFAIE